LIEVFPQKKTKPRVTTPDGLSKTHIFHTH
jgi:hypothetical protein